MLKKESIQAAKDACTIASVEMLANDAPMKKMSKKAVAIGQCAFMGVGMLFAFVSFMCGTAAPVYALEAKTTVINEFMKFVGDWLKVIGAAVVLVGGVMFALAFQRDDSEGKSRALMTVMAGGMVAALGFGEQAIRQSISG